MNARRLFVSSEGVLQPPWRIATFAVVVILSLIASDAIAGPVVSWLFGLLGVSGVSNEEWVAVIGLLAATAVVVRMIDKRPWSSVWLGSDAARPARWGLGFALGAVCVGLPTVLLIASGWLDRAAGGVGSWWVAATRVSLVLLPAALLEELLTRGYILSVLTEWLGWGWAILLTSIGFGLLHLSNPGATPLSVSLVTLAGVFLAAVLFATRSLYAAWMAHFAWNWTLAVVFHASVSGLPLESPAYRYVDAGPDWATGGEWGPEGGIPAALGMLAGIGFLLRRRSAALNAGKHQPSNLGNG